MQNNSSAPNYLKYFKTTLISLLVIIFVSTIMFLFYGFNRGVDFKGGTQLIVDFENSNINIENTDDFNFANREVQKILDNNNIIVNSFQIEGTYGVQSFVITFSEKSSSVVQKIRLEINSLLQDDFSALSQEEQIAALGTIRDLTMKTTQINSFVDSTLILSTTLALVIALIIICIYSTIRFKYAGAITILFGLVFDVLLFLSAIVLLRIEINRYIFTLICLVFAVSLYTSASMFLKIRDIAKDPNNIELSNAQVANFYLKESWKSNFVKYLFAFVMGLILTLVLSPNLVYACLAGLVGLVIIFITHHLLIPAFWVNINVNKETFTKHGVVKVDSKTIKIESKEISTNDKDDNAEVIEVKD